MSAQSIKVFLHKSINNEKGWGHGPCPTALRVPATCQQFVSAALDFLVYSNYQQCFLGVFPLCRIFKNACCPPAVVYGGA